MLYLKNYLLFCCGLCVHDLQITCSDNHMLAVSLQTCFIFDTRSTHQMSVTLLQTQLVASRHSNIKMPAPLPVFIYLLFCIYCHTDMHSTGTVPQKVIVFYHVEFFYHCIPLLVFYIFNMKTFLSILENMSPPLNSLCC